MEGAKGAINTLFDLGTRPAMPFNCYYYCSICYCSHPRCGAEIAIWISPRVHGHIAVSRRSVADRPLSLTESFHCVSCSRVCTASAERVTGRKRLHAVQYIDKTPYHLTCSHAVGACYVDLDSIRVLRCMACRPDLACGSGQGDTICTVGVQLCCFLSLRDCTSAPRFFLSTIPFVVYERMRSQSRQVYLGGRSFMLLPISSKSNSLTALIAARLLKTRLPNHHVRIRGAGMCRSYRNGAPTGYRLDFPAHDPIQEGQR